MQLGFGSQDARTQLDSLKAQNDRLETTIAEKNAEIKGANQERARLSFRVQEVKKSILGMVPRGEVDETWKEMGLLKEQVREAQRDAQNWKSKYDALSDEHSEVDDVINYMTPRPDWSKVGQYASGETEGLSSAELVQGLYRTIDEMRVGDPRAHFWMHQLLAAACLCSFRQPNAYCEVYGLHSREPGLDGRRRGLE